MTRLSAYVLFLCLASVAGCDSSKPSTPRETTNVDGVGTVTLAPVTLMLNWYPEAEHGGYYAALVHGYYEEQGLDVTIQEGGPGAPVIQQVARGAIEFGITNADRIVTARAQDAKLKALFAPLANSPRCLLVHSDAGITEFEQLENVTLMMKRENAWAQYLIKNLPLTGVDVVPNTASLAPFLADKNAVKQGYIISEPFVAKSLGADVTTLHVPKLGFNPYTSILVTRDKLLESDPELAQKMVAASLKGWQKYLESPDETNRHIHELNSEMSLEVLEYGVAAIKEHCLDSDPAALGRMNPQRWATLVSQLEELELIDHGTINAADLFTTAD